MSTPDQPSLPEPQVVRPNSTLSIVSLVTGILGWTLLPFLGSIIAVITGHMAKGEIRNSAGRLAGDGMATAGLILGYLSLLLGLCACLTFLLFPTVFWMYGDRILNTVP